MGSNVSKADTDGTIAAYTLYDKGCMKRCFSDPVFHQGSPQNDCCGTSCSRIYFDPPADQEKQRALEVLEMNLEEAANIAMESITWGSHICFTGMDMTAEQAAKDLNEGWCINQNDLLRNAGMSCQARREVYGFGRSRVTYLVIRVFPL
jgi:hypothetical protein